MVERVNMILKKSNLQIFKLYFSKLSENFVEKTEVKKSFLVKKIFLRA